MEGLQAEEQAEGPARDLGSDGDAVVVGLEGQVQHPLPLVRVEVVLEEREGDRPVDLAGQASHPVHLPVGG